MFPAAGSAEKDGCFTNTQRLLQFHNKAVDPPGDARSETWFMLSSGAAAEGKGRELIRRPRNAALNALHWDYPVRTASIAEPNVDEILKEINGWTI